MRRLWITDEPWPATQQTLDAAAQAGATEVLHGIPVSLAGAIPHGTTGYWEIEPTPEPESEPDPVEALQAQVAELTAALEALLGETP